MFDSDAVTANTPRNIAGLRVALLIGSDGPGGAERVVVQLATALSARGAHAVVFLPRDGEGWIQRQLTGCDAAIEYFTIERPLSPCSARTLAQSLRAHRIDVAHSHEFAMAVYGAWGSWRAAIPHIITMHGGRYYAERLRRRLALCAAMSVSASTVSVSSAFKVTLIRDLGVRGSRIATIPNGVHYESPRQITLRDELRLGLQHRLVVAVGNLYPVKGHLYLIDAVARLAERHPTLHVAIAGRGALDGTLRAQAARLDIHDRVHLLGLRADVPAVLEAADIFALPSLSEALPLALLEAMFAGRPIVAPDVGDVRAVLRGGELGVVVPPGDPAAIAHALDRLLGDPQNARALAAAAAVRARLDYDMSVMVDRYVTVYESVLGARQPDARRLQPARSSFDRGAVVPQQTRQ
jgi:glycosyltransferase involved in cell wall biosynthesis